MGRFKLFLGLLVFLCAFSSAAQVVVNSLDYQDVASAVFYANVIGDEVYYAYPSLDLQTAVLQVGPKEIILMESATAPVHLNYQSALQNNGATISEKLVSSDPLSFNMELAERSGASSFIITDPAYSYNLPVLFAYAKASGSYVLFATKKNAGEASNFLSSYLSGKALVYGTVDEEVLEELDSSGVSYDHLENGDKYLDNSALLERFFSKYESDNQIVLADGTFLDPAITDGNFPVVLISTTMPVSSYEFLLSLVQQDKISIAVLVEGKFTSAAYDLMKRINSNFDEKQLSVFVKIGQTSKAGGEVEPLVTYPLPAVTLDIALDALQYNTAKGEVEIILENKGSVATYVTSSLKVLSDGELVGTVGDTEPQLLDKDEKKGFSYPLAIESSGQLTGNLTTYFSSSKYNYEKVLTAVTDMGKVSFIDDSSLEVLTATYSPDADAVSIKYSNTGDKDVYFRTTIDYSSEISSSTVDDTEVRMLEPGQSTVVRVGGLLITPEELPTIEMSANTEYGGREGFLVNTMETPVELLEPEGGIDPMLLLGLLALIIIIIVAYFLTRKKGEKKEGPKHKPAKKGK